ncbi:hypothetical protein [Leptospira noguchii]|uniref:hypothetical protein n=1 Tax=Leptospira noguchii TaxID=28182 RepID=UPI0015EF48FB|nr:hypothetical protein [Leptospira noguchii]UOG30648.1 hypothetical protein MAL06_00655 [Leptospira noguchii]UOG52881.1 hypothetical protein MAL09_01185 [Leptospira noguchii]
MFPVCNLLTRAESPTGCLWPAGFAPVFLCRTHVKLSRNLQTFEQFYSNVSSA